MKFFIDTAKVEELKAACEWGLVDGVTTNPSLVATTGRSYRDVIREMAEIIEGPISAEVLATDYKGIMEEARQWAKVAPNVVVKIPLIPEGIKAVQTCSKEGIATNVTLCFQPLQALVAAKAGATYISPFIGRLDDIGQEGLHLLREIKTMYDNYGLKTQIIAASVRHLEHLRQAALLKIDIATIPFKLFSPLFMHPLTDKGLEVFLADARKIPKS